MKHLAAIKLHHVITQDWIYQREFEEGAEEQMIKDDKAELEQVIGSLH